MVGSMLTSHNGATNRASAIVRSTIDIRLNAYFTIVFLLSEAEHMFLIKISYF